MSLVIVGSVALDTIETPHGKVEDALGGSAVYASLAASYFSPTYIVGVVGEDYPAPGIELLEAHKVNLDGLETKPGKTFRWSGAYRQWSQADTLSTDLNVFADFSPQLPHSCRSCRSLLLANIHPQLQLQVLNQIESYKWAACDTMNYWISLCPELLSEVIRKVDIVFINEDEIRQHRPGQHLCRRAPPSGNGCESRGDQTRRIRQRNRFARRFVFRPGLSGGADPGPHRRRRQLCRGFMSYLATQDELNKYVIRKAVRFGTVLAAKNVSAFSVDGLVNLEFSELQQKVHQLRNWA